ncbi:MAG: NADP-specific glutamate dehydrogenase [Gammaproteobacteria bacterium]|nr:NADP-specific glutamate dehydrogenase [Gammaproteobacteria bacterium]MYI77398.1 NADP-specific glutamate dehydrogenase [Gammaproteobacteria bacterium]
MKNSHQTHLEQFMAELRRQNPHETHFHQAVEEVVESVLPWYLQHDEYRKARILERVTEPDRIVSFRVTWETDSREVEVNRGWRVQFNHTLGPYKGGLRFHPAVNQSVLKFLAFEQIFKNSLTGLPMGGAKGGADFDPKGKSDREVMRFCQALMLELHRYIGEDVDIPAGDIGVSAREISYLFAQYMRMCNRWAGVITGKSLAYGGSAVRTEATGYGCVYFCENMLNHIGDSLRGKSIAISGSGNVAIYAAEKALQMGAKVITLSDSSGFVLVPDGLNEEQLKFVQVLKEKRRGRISEFANAHDAVEFFENARPWSVPCDIAMPCATENELDLNDAQTLQKNGVFAICEGANMPLTAEAVRFFTEKEILHAPGKASNAGGVAVSGLEQSQNSLRISWSREEVDKRLQGIMTDIHQQCIQYGAQLGQVNYVAGANIGGFKRVADTMLAYGIV